MYRLVHSRLDCGNGVLVDLPVYLTRQLQSVLNAAARLIYRLKTCDHITDALICLHWLRDAGSRANTIQAGCSVVQSDTRRRTALRSLHRPRH